MKKSCKNCIYRENSCSKENTVCGDYFKGNPEDLAEHETDMSDITGEESFEDFCEHEDWE